MEESLLEKTREILEMLRAGQFVEGIEKFYAADVINEEATGDRIIGLDNLIAHEKRILEQVEHYHGITIYSVGTGEDDGKGNGVTFAEYSLRVDLKDGSSFNPDQVQVTRWENGKAKHIKFYYNPNF